MQQDKVVQVCSVLILSVLLICSPAFSYTILWDTSHGVLSSDNGGFEPSGSYKTLADHLAENGFTVETTSAGFLVDDPGGYDVAVVCLTSAYNSAYVAEEVSRIADFVNDGGGLLIMGDLLNQPNANVQPIASEFGITFGPTNVGLFEINTTDLDAHRLFSGISSISLRGASELSLSGPANAVARQEGTGKNMVAVAEPGQGRVVAIGDSSLFSDGSNPANHYFFNAENPQFSVNTFEYLAIPEPATLLILSGGTVLLLRKR